MRDEGERPREGVCVWAQAKKGTNWITSRGERRLVFLFFKKKKMRARLHQTISGAQTWPTICWLEQRLAVTGEVPKFYRRRCKYFLGTGPW